jgi:hypothetical protein
MVAKPLLLKCWRRRVIIVIEDVGEAPHAEVLSRRVIADDEDVGKVLMAKVLINAMLE